MNLKKLGVVLAAILLLASACAPRPAPGPTGGEPRFGGTLIKAMVSNPPTLDQMTTTGTLSKVIGAHMFESLFSLDSTFSPIPHLVATYTINADATEYVFSLRRGVRFHNGAEMTSADVVASVERWGKVSSFGRTFMGNVDKIEAVDTYTVRVALSRPNVLVPLQFSDGFAATLVIMPREVMERFPDKPIDDLTALIGTGPYRFVEYIPDVHVRLDRFDGYAALDTPANGFGGKRVAYLDTILFRPVPDAMVRLTGVEVGDFHFAERVPPDEYPSIKANPNLKTALVSPARWGSAVLNNSRGVFADKRMRQAVLAALDMEDILRAAHGPEELWRLNPSMMFHEQAMWTDAGKEFYNQKNPDRARQLMAEAGYQGEKIVWIVSPDYPDHYASALAAKAQLERVGFNIDLQALDWPTVMSRRSNPELWDIFTTYFMVSWDPTLLMVLTPTFAGWYNSAEMQEYMNQLREEKDPARRMAIWEKAQRLFYEDVPTIQYGDNLLFDVLRPNVQGYWPSAFPFFWNVWLD